MKILKDFFTDSGETAQGIRSALDTEDLEYARRTIHTMKGLSGTIGAAALSRASRDLEAALGREDLDGARALFQHFAGELSTVRQSIEPIVSRAYEQNIASDDRDLEQVHPVLQTLDELLFHSDSRAEECFASIQPWLLISGFQDQARTLEAALDNYDFSEAHEVLASVFKALNMPTQDKDNGR